LQTEGATQSTSSVQKNGGDAQSVELPPSHDAAARTQTPTLQRHVFPGAQSLSRAHSVLHAVEPQAYG
jgi:hypothetical protein